MQITVIMSEYNTDSKILEKSIQSIINQTYKDFEFIIINDGKSDELAKIINKIDDQRIRLIENGTNLGLAASLNKAIDLSNGKYIVRMDTDDISHPKRIEKQLSFIQKHKQYSVVGTSVNILTENDVKIPKVNKGEIDKNLLMDRKGPVHPSVIMNKEDILEVGKYETRNVNRCEDFVLWSKILLSNKKIYVMEEVLLDYRVNIHDYKKRKLTTRADEIRNRFKYYKKFNATTIQYLSIFKSILAGILPKHFMAFYHRNF